MQRCAAWPGRTAGFVRAWVYRLAQWALGFHLSMKGLTAAIFRNPFKALIFAPIDRHTMIRIYRFETAFRAGCRPHPPGAIFFDDEPLLANQLSIGPSQIGDSLFNAFNMPWVRAAAAADNIGAGVD